MGQEYQGGEGSWGADGSLQGYLRAPGSVGRQAASPMVPYGFLPAADVGHTGEGGAANRTLPPGLGEGVLPPQCPAPPGSHGRPF